jgi:tRNA/tmRNA/rRNA uracil-C5-methylase (TrmA/RlmC/RlmD family)
MRRGERFELKIDQLTFGGDGIGRHPSGIAVFVPFAAPGDAALVEAVHVKARHARARLLSLVETSAVRETPVCPLYRRCGGCQYQHITYAEECRQKERQVRDAFERLGRLADPPLRPIIPSPEPYAYRNRITVHGGDDGRLGFQGVDGLVDAAACALAMPEVNEALRRLRARHPGPGHYSVRHPDIPPSAFYQTNHLLLETLRETVADAVTSVAPPPACILEGYAGGGFFTFALAKRGCTVTAIEKDERSLRDAKRLAKGKIAPAITFVEGDAALELPKLLGPASVARPAWDAVLVDPPRDGLPRPLAESLADAPGLVYVSCNPPALARDLPLLMTRGLHLEAVTPIDLFPRTAHIECVATLRRTRFS